MLQRINFRHTSLLVFGILNFLASIFALAWLLRIPSDEKGAVWLGLSLQRIGLLGIMLLAIVSFGGLVLLIGRRPAFNQWIENKIFDASWSAGLFVGFCILALTVWFYMLLTPPALARYVALNERLSPVLTLAGLVFSAAAVLLLLCAAPARTWCKKMLAELEKLRANPAAGWILLGLALIVSLTQVYYSFYNLGDEGDTITTGWLIAQGNVLYKDIFSHHFPFSYYWAALVVKLFGTSIFAIRASLIVLWTVCFGITMKLSRYTVGLGLAALAWSILGQFYLGNMLQFYSFSSVFIACSFGLVLSLLNRRSLSGPRTLAAAGVFLALAILTDPLTAYPAAILVAAVFLAGVSERSVKKGLVQAGTLAGVMLACGAIYLVYLLVTGSLQPFVQNAILFNTQVYNRYADALRAAQFYSPAASGLGIFDSHWTRFTDPYLDLSYFDRIDQWVYTGFFYRLVFILSGTALLLRRNYLAGIVVYLMGASLLFRASEYFQSAPFVLLSFCVVSLGISGAVRAASTDGPLPSPSGLKRFGDPLRILVSSTMLVLLGLMFAWLNLRGIAALVNHRDNLTYASNFSNLAGTASYYNKMTCHLPDAKILVYPLDPYEYVLSGKLPASRYSFMTPWVAEVGQDETIAALGQPQLALVYVNQESETWGYPTKVYLKKLIDFLDKYYVKIGSDFYQSPQLHQVCPAGG